MPGRFGNGCGEGFPTIVSKPVPCLKGRKKAGPYRPCFFMQEGLAASAVIAVSYTHLNVLWLAGSAANFGGAQAGTISEEREPLS